MLKNLPIVKKNELFRLNCICSIWLVNVQLIPIFYHPSKFLELFSLSDSKENNDLF